MGGHAARHGGFGRAEKRRRAGELALIVANHLFAAARAGDDIMKLSKDLEGAGADSGEAGNPEPASPARSRRNGARNGRIDRRLIESRAAPGRVDFGNIAVL